MAATLLAVAPAGAAPAAPVGLAPNAVATSGTPVLSWNRVAGATSYTVQYSTDADFSTGVTTVGTANRRYVPTRRLPSGTNWWRVRATAASGTSGWRTASFTMSTIAGPSLLAPTDGQVLDQPDDPVLLSWTPLNGAASYTVEIDDSPDFLTPTIRPGIQTSAFILDNPQVATTYYWHVKAIFDTGVESIFSDHRTFQVGGLAKPVLVSPADDPSNAVDDVELRWEPVMGAHHYELQVSTADSFSTLVDNQANIVGTTFSPATTYHNDQYYWRVRPVDAFGNKLAWDTVDTWEFRRAWPEQPTLQYPIDDDVVGDPFYFQWTAVPLASEYVVQMSESSLFPAGATSSCRSVHTTYVPRVNGDCWPGASRTYYWRVLVEDDPRVVGSEVDHAEVQRFSYQPEVVDMSSATPADGSTVSVPILRWNPVAGAATYRVFLEALDGGAGAFSGRVTSMTSMTPQVKLTPGKQYRWYVQTAAFSGRLGSGFAESARSVFTVGSFPAGTTPPTLTLTGPASGAIFNRYPTLTWEPVNGAAYYRIFTRNADGIAAFQDLGAKFEYPAGENSASDNLPGNTQWMVKAYDGTNAVIAESGARIFTLQTLGSVTGFQASITGSASESPGTSCLASLPARCANMRQTPVFRWSPVLDAGYYKLWISRDPTFTNVVAGYDGLKVETNMFMPIAALPDSQAADAYYWQVVPCTSGEACAPRTDATHAVNKKSNPVELLSPVNDANGPDSVRFTWRDYLETNLAPGAADSTGVNARIEARNYLVQVSNVPNFQNLIDNVIVDQQSYTANAKFYPEGFLYWRVAAIDATGNTLTFSNESEGVFRKFEKRTPYPTLHKLNGGAPLTQTVPFSWDPEPHAASYVLEIYRNNDKVPSLVNRVIALAGKQSTLTLNAPLPPSAQPYTWRVRKVDATGNGGPWSPLTGPGSENSTFTVVGAAPTLVTPAASAKVSSTEAYFTWTAVDGAKSYRFERRQVGESTISDGVTTAALAHAPISAIPDGAWQWRVVAVNAANADLGASPWRGFTVDSARPMVTAVSPVANKVGVKRSVNFKATFSERVTNVTAATVKLYRKGQASPVSAKVTLSSNKRVMTLNPTKLLARGKVYTVKVSSSVRDLSNLPLVPMKWKVTVRK